MAPVAIRLATFFTWTFLGHGDNLIIGDRDKHSACISDKHEIISSLYEQIVYDPRSESKDEQNLASCHSRSIWMSSDSTLVIYYKQFSHSDIGFKFNDDDDDDATKEIAGFGVFECAPDAYMTALRAQADDIASDALCVDPKSVFPDSYAGALCQPRPKAYCLPLRDASKCPQFQTTMTSMYNRIDADKDFITDIAHFYDCNCWYQANDEGDINDDMRIHIAINFNEDCVAMQTQKTAMEAEQAENALAYAREKHQEMERFEQKEKESEYAQEIELEKHREFSILWATLGLMTGFIALIVVGIYSCRKQYDKKMYLTSRSYYRQAHSGEIENDNLMQKEESDTETDTDDDSQTESVSSGEDDDADTNNDTDGTDLSTELAYNEDTATTYCSE
eukprot:CAMPEP_0202709820 /NCGR_PEP_ID=MMETSP1385-20130828/21896_1 /ASSEMBLY_ACC=CAM_ASM_000861 /TAXON_ID=933848 /ORGANISM="Elphidium margaritaceum" /LENGTH=391 /DNA_ID=CAMNT_0049369187 /DNA_START=26 /DNA_END=1198 /DNA_ORIENTATION=-